MLTTTQIRDVKGAVHDLGELVNTQCSINVLRSISTPQPGVYMIDSRAFYPTAEKRWVYEASIGSDITYSSEELARILNVRQSNVIISQH